MAADLATLAIQIKTDSVATATKSLQELESAGKKTETAISKLQKAVEVAMSALAAYKLGDMARDAAMLAARYETLGVVMGVVGKNAGYSASAMEYYAKALQTTGISMVESRANITKLVQSHMDLSRATELARAAQDAAVIANINSSEAFANMVHAIQSGQSDILRNMGIAVSWEQAYRSMARTLGTVPDALTEAEKTQARMDATLLSSKASIGVYGAAMDTASKQIQSFKRYVQDFQVEFGKAFGPALTDIVRHATDYIKKLTETIKSQEMQDRLKGLGDTAKNTFDSIASIGSHIGGLFTTVLDGWNKMPAIIQELGLVGALVGGVKGKAILLGATYTLGVLDDRAKGIAAVQEGKMTLDEYTSSGPAELKKKLDAIGAAKSWSPLSQEESDAKERATMALINKPTSAPLTASWYGPGFAGRKAADGSVFDPNAMTVASKSYPLGTVLKLVYEGVGPDGKPLSNSVNAKVTDRGPFIEGRDIDLSEGVARALTAGMGKDYKQLGVFNVNAVPQSQADVANLFGEAQVAFDAQGKPGSVAYMEAQLSKRQASMQRMADLMKLYATDDQSKQLADLYQSSIGDAVTDEKRSIFSKVLGEEGRIRAPKEAAEDAGRQYMDMLYDAMIAEAQQKGDPITAATIQASKDRMDQTAELAKEWMGAWDKFREAEYVGDGAAAAQFKNTLVMLNERNDSLGETLEKQKQYNLLVAQANALSAKAGHDSVMSDLTEGRAVNVDVAKRQSLWAQMLQAGAKDGDWNKAGDEFHASVAKMVRDHEDAVLDLNRQWADGYGTRADQYAAETDLLKREYEKQLAAAGESAERRAAVERLYAAKIKEVKARADDDWVEGARRGVKDVVDSQQSLYDAARQGMVNFQNTAKGVWVQWVTTGKLSINDIKTTFLAAMAEMAYQRTLGSALSKGLDMALGLFSGYSSTGAPGTAQGSGPASHANDAAAWGGTIPSAKGNVLTGPGISALSGGVYSQPTYFGFDRLHAFAQGGVLGEAGEEAVMPLRRGPDGKLGVAASGGGGQVITINAPVTVNASGGTQEQNADLAKQMGKQVSAELRALVRDELAQQMRPRGSLYGRA